MEPAEDWRVKLDPDLLAKAKEWWEYHCPEEVKSGCSIWVILALFAHCLKNPGGQGWR
jgi:hypothetical protein